MAHSLIQITINLFQILMTKESRYHTQCQCQIIPSVPYPCRERDRVGENVSLPQESKLLCSSINEPKFGLQWKPPALQILSLQQTLLLTKCFSSVLRLQFAGSSSYNCNSTWLSKRKWWEQSLSQFSVENRGEIQWECRILICSSISTCCSNY